jgi:hypothetical protein
MNIYPPRIIAEDSRGADKGLILVRFGTFRDWDRSLILARTLG